MATVLTSDLTRETTVKVDDREIILTLTEAQKISMRLKGMKTGDVEISIADLYNQLKGVPTENENTSSTTPKGVELTSYKGDDAYLISVAEFRAAALVYGFDLETTSKFESFLSEFIKTRKNRKNT